MRSILRRPAATLLLACGLIAPRLALASCPFDTTLFASPVLLASGVGTVGGAAICDVNNDGIQDVVLAPGGTAGFRFLTMNAISGHWNGTFSTVNGPAYLGTAGKGLATGDLNKDGRPDVVTFEPPYMSALMAPAGGLVAATGADRYSMIFDGVQPRLADVDRDGVLDVVVARGANGVSVVRGFLTSTGSGYAFGAITTTATGGNARDVALADLDHDGALDIVAATSGTGVVVIPGLLDALARPTGTFGAPHTVPVTTAGHEVWDVVAADLDEDGWDDLVVAVVATSGTSSVAVLMNQGNGTFPAVNSTNVIGQPTSLVVFDADRDGTLDVLTTAAGGANGTANVNELQGARQPLPQRFTLGTALPFGTVRNGTMLAAGDLDDDGSTELVVPAPTSSVILQPTCSPGAYTIRVAISGPGQVTRQLVTGPLANAGALARLVPAATDPEFHFAGWADDTTGSMNPFDFTVTRNRTYRATFSRNEYALDVVIDGGGSVTRSPNQALYPSGTVVGLTATPVVGTQFSSWSGNASGTNPVTNVTMTGGNKQVTAHFVNVDVTLTLGVVGSGHVDRSPALASYPINSTVNLTGVADDGWRFGQWSGDASGVDSFFSLLMSTNRSVTATFVRDPQSPLIRAVKDLPGDEGGQVKLEWFASSLDVAGAGPGGIGSYLVFRDVPTSAALAELRAGRARLVGSGEAASGTLRRFVHTSSAGGDFFWEYLVTVPAAGFTGYSYVAPTTLDSSAAGPAWTRFKLQARSKDGLVWYNSSPDSGKSVDNLAPAAPAPVSVVTAPTTNDLHWPRNPAPDLARYRVYRGGTSSFVPGALTLIGEVSDTTYDDATTASAWYKITALDVHGNESAPGAVFASRATDAGSPPPARLQFAAHPNPTPDRTVFTLSLPQAARARVQVLDANGRRVVTLADGEFAAGRWPLAWDGRDAQGRALAGGMYFALAEVNGRRMVSRLVLLR